MYQFSRAYILAPSLQRKLATNMFNPPIGDGANTFVWIVCIIIGFAAGVGFLDIRKTSKKKHEEEK